MYYVGLLCGCPSLATSKRPLARRGLERANPKGLSPGMSEVLKAIPHVYRGPWRA